MGLLIENTQEIKDLIDEISKFCEISILDYQVTDRLLDGTVFSSLSTETVKDCSLSTGNKIEHGDFSLLLCYAEKGEKIVCLT